MKKLTIIILFCVLLQLAACKGPLIEKGMRYVLQPKMEAGLHSFAYETMSRLYQICQEKKIDLGDVRVHQDKIVITGIELAHDPRLQDIVRINFPDWEADVAKNQLVMSLKPEITTRLQFQMMTQTMAALKGRLSEKTELYPVLQQLGVPPKARILVTLVTDKELAVYNLFYSQGVLEFCKVIDGPFKTKEALQAKFSQGIRGDWKVTESKNREWFLLSRWPLVTGRDIESAKSDIDQFGTPAVGVTFNGSGAKRLESFSKANIGKMLAIVLDGQIYSAPRIESKISRDVRITGNFNKEQVQDLVTILKSGALPVPLKLLEERKIEGEMELEQGIVFEFALTPVQKMADVRKKLDQIQLNKYKLQQAEGGNLILNVTDIPGNFNHKEFLDKLSAAVGKYNLISVEPLSSSIKMKTPVI